MMSDIRTSNYQKYQTANPVVQKLIGGFQQTIRSILDDLQPKSILDAGCGEGALIPLLNNIDPARYTGIDANEECVEYCKRSYPEYRFAQGSIYSLSFQNDEFDVATSLEVLEHLKEPEKALQELERVARHALVLSVPHEPWFRFGSLLRGKYLSDFGNHPEHIQHWNPKSFKHFLHDHLTAASSIRIDQSFPWVIATIRLNKTSA